MNRKDKAKEIVSVFGKELGLKHVRILIEKVESYVEFTEFTKDNEYTPEYEVSRAEQRISYLIDVEREINKIV